MEKNKELKKVLTRQTLKIFWQHTKPYWPYALLAVGGSWLAVIVEVYRPWLYRSLLNIFAQGPTYYQQAVIVVLGLLGLGVLRLIFRRCMEYGAIQYQSNAKRDLWLTSFKELHRQDYSYFTNQFTGTLVKRANRYDGAYEQIMDQITFGLGQTIVRVAITIVSIAFFRIDVALGFLLWALVYLAYVLHKLKTKRPYDLEKAEVDSKVSGWLADTVSNFPTIKLFASHKREEELFKQKVNWFRDTLLRQWRISFKLDSGQAILVILLETAVFLWALQLWKQGNLSVGDMALLQLYVTSLNNTLWDLGRQLKTITQSLADANEMTEIVLQPKTMADAPKAKQLKVSKGEIEFRSADFTYGAEGKVLNNLSLTVPSGQKLALVGPSGGGKTTITKLLLRLYDVTGGSVLVDGQDIAKVTQDSLREAISFVPQEPILFHRSLLENIRYGNPKATEADVVAAAKLAHAHEFITKSSEGYETLVGERGVKLSGGERQRVAIARAILKDSPILVLDEATSSLDSESEMLIQDALKHLMKNKTVIVIAHRLSTIMQMDRIVVLENGVIIEDGKHAELIKVKQGVYQKLWDIQAGSFH